MLWRATNLATLLPVASLFVGAPSLETMLCCCRLCPPLAVWPLRPPPKLPPRQQPMPCKYCRSWWPCQASTCAAWAPALPTCCSSCSRQGATLPGYVRVDLLPVMELCRCQIERELANVDAALLEHCLCFNSCRSSVAMAHFAQSRCAPQLQQPGDLTDAHLLHACCVAQLGWQVYLWFNLNGNHCQLLRCCSCCAAHR